jgi:hypothetical protein
VMHGAAGRLLAVAQGGVEEDDLVIEWHGSGALRMDISIIQSYAGGGIYAYFLCWYRCSAALKTILLGEGERQNGSRGRSHKIVVSHLRNG